MELHYLLIFVVDISPKSKFAISRDARSRVFLANFILAATVFRYCCEPIGDARETKGMYPRPREVEVNIDGEAKHNSVLRREYILRQKKSRRTPIYTH